MDNDSVLKLRLPSDLKLAFESVCEAIQQPTSAVMRVLIEEWLRTTGRLTREHVEVTIFKPEEYDPGAWRMAIGLRESRIGMFGSTPIPFPLPDLPMRSIQSDDGFSAMLQRNGEHALGGRFVNGVWRGHLYSNGCPESRNPTSIETVRKSLLESVYVALRPFDKFKEE